MALPIPARTSAIYLFHFHKLVHWSPLLFCLTLSGPVLLVLKGIPDLKTNEETQTPRCSIMTRKGMHRIETASGQ